MGQTSCILLGFASMPMSLTEKYHSHLFTRCNMYHIPSHLRRLLLTCLSTCISYQTFLCSSSVNAHKYSFGRTFPAGRCLHFSLTVNSETTTEFRAGISSKLMWLWACDVVDLYLYSFPYILLVLSNSGWHRNIMWCEQRGIAPNCC